MGGRAIVVAQGGFTLNYGYHYILGGSRAIHQLILRTIAKDVPMQESRVEAFYQFRRGALHRLVVGPRNRLMPLTSQLRLVRLTAHLLKTRPDSALEIPLGVWLAAATPDPLVRQYFLDFAQATFFTGQPECVSAGRFMRLVQHQLRVFRRPSLFPQGTWRTLLAALQERIVESGGESACGQGWSVSAYGWSGCCCLGRWSAMDRSGCGGCHSPATIKGGLTAWPPRIGSRAMGGARAYSRCQC